MTRVRNVIAQRGLTSFLSALLAFGLTLTLSEAMEFPLYMPMAGAVCAACLLFYLLTELHWSARAIGIVGAAGAIAYILLKYDVIDPIVKAVERMIAGDENALRVHALTLECVAAGTLTFFCMLANRQREGFYPCLSLACVVALWSWMGGKANHPMTFAPVLAALAALYARTHCEQTSGSRAVSMAGLAVALALLLVPSSVMINDKLAEFAERIRKFDFSLLTSDTSHNYYSIEKDGLPRYGGMLGGPVSLSDRPVMRVETDTALLLRSITKDRYTGQLWENTSGVRTYKYDDARRQRIYADVMDLDRPLRSLRDARVFQPVYARVTMLGDNNAATLLVPHRLESLGVDSGLVAYFGDTGEVFADRDLKEGDAYSFSAPVLALDDPALAALAEAAARSGAQGLDASARGKYLALPGGIDPRVVLTVGELTSGRASELEKLKAIRDELGKLPYTLTPKDTPPRGADFVSFFLLDGREGYCTYFASAMAVMGRIAGIPTRYVEGFIAKPEDGIAYVTGRNAHAWVEAYLTGFGWISVDATPGEQSPEGGGSDNPNPDSNSDTTPNPGDVEPSPTPMPTPEQTEQPGGADPSPTARPGNEEPDNTPDDSQANGHKRDLKWLWISLAVLLVIAALAARSYWTSPKAAANRRSLADEKLLVWYRAGLRLIAAQGNPASPYETPAALAHRSPMIAPLFDAVEHLAYSGQPPEEGVIAAGAEAYRLALRHAGVRVKVRVWLNRMVFGAGKIAIVP